MISKRLTPHVEEALAGYQNGFRRQEINNQQHISNKKYP
jgi:hypothetical protein